MSKHDSKVRKERTDSGKQTDHSNVSPTLKDPIEPDPMNPVQAPPADIESKSAERPDLDWAEHED